MVEEFSWLSLRRKNVANRPRELNWWLEFFVIPILWLLRPILAIIFIIYKHTYIFRKRSEKLRHEDFRHSLRCCYTAL